MDLSLPVVLWQVRQGHAQFRCVIGQLGEEWFELELFRGEKLMMSESFDDPAPLLVLADALRADLRKLKVH